MNNLPVNLAHSRGRGRGTNRNEDLNRGPAPILVCGIYKKKLLQLSLD